MDAFLPPRALHGTLIDSRPFGAIAAAAVAPPSAPRLPRDAHSRPLLLDTTMFWSATGGGVRRYLLTKRDWLASGQPLQRDALRPLWRHAIAAPGLDPSIGLDLGGVPLPGSGGYRLVLGRRAAARAMAALAPDVIEAGDPFRLAWAALDAGQSLGVPTVAFCHSDLPAMAECCAGRHALARRHARHAAERYLRHVYREFDLVLAPGRALAERLGALGLARVRQQPMGVDTAVFRPQPAEPGLRERLGLAPATKLLLYAGRFAPEKNLGLLVEALKRLGPEHALLLVGAGPARPSAHERVRVLPYEPDPPALARLMAGVDAFVHAGDQETFGIAPLEAMACGTPVVVRAAGGLAEICAPGAGLAIDSARPDAWAEAIRSVCSVPRERWARAARQHALQFRWDRMLPRLLGHYDALLGLKPVASLAAHDASIAWQGP
ncbi:MAG TPA: glycosyltransferase [Methylibium sp.]|uniref:glycosyltransferase n=1 Tax=Methylibium sp. TaxID=2067992 RepID=UPI002DB7E0F8|nr:glycosyltransferase [Methylibium sp.]HEU4459109.1 glycosyltransferase [Methylibium sp.]